MSYGEFLFEFIGEIPVIYVSKFIDSPTLLKISINILLDLIPVFQHFRNNDTEINEYDSLIQTICSAVSMVSNLCDTLKQNNKSLGFIAQNILEQKKKNEEKLQTCLNDITHLTEKYKNKIKNNFKNVPSSNELFDVLYNERKKIKGKYIYKKIIEEVVTKKTIKNVYTADQILRILPKAKFEQMCIIFESENQLK